MALYSFTTPQGAPSGEFAWYASRRRSNSAFCSSVSGTAFGTSTTLSQISSTSRMRSGTLRFKMSDFASVFITVVSYKPCDPFAISFLCRIVLYVVNHASARFATIKHDRRRGMKRRHFSVAPKLARRFALSSDTRASRPMRTNEVFSFTPVISVAFRRIRSSMLNVVRMQINMHYTVHHCASVVFEPTPARVSASLRAVNFTRWLGVFLIYKSFKLGLHFRKSRHRQVAAVS